METVVIPANNAPYTMQRPKTSTMPLNRTETRRLEDEYAISLIEEGLKSESVSLDEVLNFLRQ